MKNIYLLSQTKIDGCISNPILKTNFLQASEIPDFDCLIFTSKNAVIAFDKLYPSWKKYPSFAIGEATAKEIEKLGGRVSFVSESHYGEDLANVINCSYRGLVFLWPRAKKVAVDLINVVKSSKCHQVVVYETKFNEEYKSIVDTNSAIIFSSPSTVEYFMQNQEWKAGFKAIAIGNTTAKKLLDFGIKSEVSENQTLKSSIELAKKLNC